MELIKINNFLVSYIRNGNDSWGNPIYLINVFCPMGYEKYYNCNYRLNKKTDKYGNIKVQSYNINDSIKDLLKDVE